MRLSVRAESSEMSVIILGISEFSFSLVVHFNPHADDGTV